MKIALTIIICILGLLTLLCSFLVFCCIRVGAESDQNWECGEHKK